MMSHGACIKREIVDISYEPNKHTMMVLNISCVVWPHRLKPVWDYICDPFFSHLLPLFQTVTFKENNTSLYKSCIFLFRVWIDKLFPNQFDQTKLWNEKLPNYTYLNACYIARQLNHTMCMLFHWHKWKDTTRNVQTIVHSNQILKSPIPMSTTQGMVKSICYKKVTMFQCTSSDWD